MATSIYGNENQAHLEVKYYDHGNPEMDATLSFVYDQFGDGSELDLIVFQWHELRDILKELKKDDPKLYDLIVEKVE